mgnify:CR=1 FL=1
MKLLKTEKGLFLETEYRTGNKAWCALITGTDPKWKYSREFLNGTRKGLKLTAVEDGDIIEEVVFSHSGKNRSTEFQIIKDGELSPISAKDVILHFS